MTHWIPASNLPDFLPGKLCSSDYYVLLEDGTQRIAYFADGHAAETLGYPTWLESHSCETLDSVLYYREIHSPPVLSPLTVTHTFLFTPDEFLETWNSLRKDAPATQEDFLRWVKYQMGRDLDFRKCTFHETIHHG